MDLGILYELRSKKGWWLDIIYYLSMSFLVASILCWLIFSAKVMLQNNSISDVQKAIDNIKNGPQASHEKEVLDYKRKIENFVFLLGGHQLSSNLLSFIEVNTYPNIWFSKFDMSEGTNELKISGFTDTIETISRQMDIFEKSEYVKLISLLRSSTDPGGYVSFVLALSLDPKIFTEYVKPTPVPTSTPQPTFSASTPEPSVTPLPNNSKLIISFYFLTPETKGDVNQTDHTIILTVPAGTDVTKLVPSTVISPNATLLPPDGQAQDFTKPVVYTITAEDGSAQDYTVIVNVEKPPVKKSSKIGGVIMTMLVLLVIVGVAITGVVIFLRKKNSNNLDF